MNVNTRRFVLAAIPALWWDVHRLISGNRFQFYEVTGETPETFIELVNCLHISPRNDHKISIPNRVLLFVMLLRNYPTYHMLSCLFGIGVTTAKEVVRGLIPLFEITMNRHIKWPTLGEWGQKIGYWDKIPCAVGSIDGTSHEIYRPGVEPQEPFYSGYRHYHTLHTQVIVDIEGVVVYVESRFLGHMNDAQQHALMLQVGTDLEFPPECNLLGDTIYPNRYPILTTYSAAQLARKRDRERRQCRKFNQYVRTYRVSVEHAIREIKCYRVIGCIWRHPRHLLGRIVKLCTGLVCRREQICLIYWRVARSSSIL